jgi:hypothetical protein
MLPRIADSPVAKQFGAFDRLLFRATVQLLDGVTDTQPNADGALGWCTPSSASQLR